MKNKKWTGRWKINNTKLEVENGKDNCKTKKEKNIDYRLKKQTNNLPAPLPLKKSKYLPNSIVQLGLGLILTLK